jgi:hypothetical protein
MEASARLTREVCEALRDVQSPAEHSADPVTDL